MEEYIGAKAYDFGKLKHKGQKDDSGKDYFIEHVCQVGVIISILCPKDDNLIAASYFMFYY